MILQLLITWGILTLLGLATLAYAYVLTSASEEQEWDYAVSEVGD